MEIIKVGMLGIISVLMAIMLKQSKSEYAIYISIAVSLVIFGYAISKILAIVQTVEAVFLEAFSGQAYMAVLMKIVGIAYISDLSSNLCKDAGYSAVATQIETFGKLSMMVVSLPVLMALLEMIKQYF